MYKWGDYFQKSKKKYEKLLCNILLIPDILGMKEVIVTEKEKEEEGRKERKKGKGGREEERKKKRDGGRREGRKEERKKGPKSDCAQKSGTRVRPVFRTLMCQRSVEHVFKTPALALPSHHPSVCLQCFLNLLFLVLPAAPKAVFSLCHWEDSKPLLTGISLLCCILCTVAR